MSLSKDIKSAMFKEGYNTRLGNIADMVGKDEDTVRDIMKGLDFKEYVDLMRALRDQDVEAAERILGLGGVNESEINTLAKIDYDYSEDWGSIELYKDGKQVEDWNDYFGANETGNPLVAKFVELCKKHGIDPMTINLVDGESGSKGSFDGKRFHWDEQGVEEAYSQGSTQSPSQMRASKTGQEVEPKAASSAQKTQAMSRLGTKNLGGATAQQTADALSKAGEGKPLTPIQRKAMAQQASSVDALASDPRTATQFRNLLNKLNQK